MLKTLNKLTVAVVATVFCTALASQEKSLAVLPTRVSDKSISQSFQDHLRNLLESAAANTNFYKMAERDRVDQIQEENIYKTMKLLKVDYVLIPQLELLKNNTLSINCWLTILEKTTVKFAGTTAANDLVSFNAACDDLISKLILEPVYDAEETKNLYRPRTPELPSIVRVNRHLRGLLQVETIIGTDGLPKNIKVIEGPLSSYLRFYAVNFIKRWKFKPATLNGRPVESKFIIRLNIEGGAKYYFTRGL